MHFLKFFRNDFWEDYFLKTDKNSETHLVTIDLKEGTVTCDCKDFKFRKENLKFGGVKLTDTDNHCKHIKAALKLRDVLLEEEV